MIALQMRFMKYAKVVIFILMLFLSWLLITSVMNFLYTTYSSPNTISASKVVIVNSERQTVPRLFYTSNYSNDSACIQAALDYSKSGDTIIISEGEYFITKNITQNDKNLNIIGAGKVTLHLQTAEGENNGIVLAGSVITDQNLYSNAEKNSSEVVLMDSSLVRPNDLIKIWKNVQWCPLDYPDQMTGEMYVVKSIKGNIITINQPLLRDYYLADSSQVEIYRPIELHIKNISVQDCDAKKSHEGLALGYCKDSSITNCFFNDSGFAALSMYSCFNMTVDNNKISNSLLPGSGYGVAVWSGSAFVNITNNYIENCRHAVTCNTDERISLDRNVYVANNELHGASIGGSNVVDAHACTIDMTVSGNIIYPCYKDPAFADGARISTFENNKVYGGLAAVCRRGSVNNGINIIQDNYIENTLVYNGLNNGIGDILIIRNNIQKGGNYGINFADNESFKNLIISENKFSNLSYQGYYQKFLLSGVNLNISNNTFENVKLDAIYVDGNSFTPVVVKVQNNTLINVYPSNSYSGITLKNIQNAYVSGNQIFKN
jgi:hypothetical protein